MKSRGIGLFSGGLDSVLSVVILRDQGIEVRGIAFETPFFDSRKARAMAQAIDLPLRAVDITDPHLSMLESPRYGFGRQMNPCIDCHALMLRIAGQWMEETGADFLFTGEVLGQRPMSQQKQSLYVVAKHSGFGDRILRPLSARLLPETQPEREGIVDRSRLLALSGRGRKSQIELAARYGIVGYPPPAGGCLLTDPVFSRRLRDLFAHGVRTVRDIELLKHGRHFRASTGHKIIVGRQMGDNRAIEELFRDGDSLLRAIGFPGPSVLVTGRNHAGALPEAAGLCLRYSDAPKDRPVQVLCIRGDGQTVLDALAVPPETSETLLV